MRYVLCTLTIVLTLFIPMPSYSFFGNISIGGVHLPCAIGCGGSRGIVNLGFAGDAVNSFVTGPSIEGFQNAANAAADRATAKLDEVITRQKADFFEKLTELANSQRALLITQLNDATQNALLGLDDILQRQLREADLLLESRLGTLDVVLTKNTQELSSSLKRLLIFVLIFSALGYILWLLYVRKFVDNRPIAPYLPRMGAILGLSLSLAALVYVVTLANDAIARKEVLSSFESNFGKSLKEQNFDYAVYYSTQLQFIDRFNEKYNAQAEKARLLRDVFSRPALYRSANGARELLARLGNAQKGYVRATGRLDVDLNILYGFAIWQRGDDRFSEYVAASILADQLKQASESNGQDAPTLLPFAVYYLTSYLANPLPDEVIQKLYLDNDHIAAADVFKALPPSKDTAELSPLRQRFSAAELQQALAGNKVDIDKLARTNPLYAFVRVSMEAVGTYRVVVSQYAELIRLSGNLSIASEAERPTLRSAIRAAGKAIIDRWDGYEKFLNRADYSDQTAKLNNFRSLWPIYTRAIGAAALKDTDNAITPAPEPNGIHNRWLQDVVQASVRDTTFRLMTTTTKSDFGVMEAKLAAIDKLTKDYFGAVAARKPLIGQATPAANTATSLVVTTGQTLAAATAEIGLIGCMHSASASLACLPEDGFPAPLGTLLFRTTAGLDDRIVNTDNVIGQLVTVRPVPAF